MARRLQVGIVGFGTAGQAAAILLARDGHAVHVFEQAPLPGPSGAGVLLQPTGLDVLWRMGLLAPALAHGARIARLSGHTAAGRPVMDMRYADLDGALFGLGMQRGALFELLSSAFQGLGALHPGVRIVDGDVETGRVRDATGRLHGPFDLVLAADGAASRLRTTVDPAARVVPYPWGALWCLVPAAGWAWPQTLEQRYVAARHMVGMLPVGRRAADASDRLSFFWSLRLDRFEAWQHTGPAAWRAHVRRIWPEAEAQLGAGFDSASLTLATYRDAVPTRWRSGRMVLLGDAAHAMSPQLGQGVNMALLDALALRDALRLPLGLPAALSQFERARRRHVALYQFWSRWLTPVFQSDRALPAWARDRAFLHLGRLPGGRGHMLRVLAGTQHGWWGRLPLDPGFVAACAEASPGRR